MRRGPLRILRDDRDCCLFSPAGSHHDFLYFSHRDRALRALFYGDGFIDEIPRLLQEPGLCIECGLGLRIIGGVSLDGPDCIAWNCSRDAANRILAGLMRCMGEEGGFIRPL